MDLSGKSKKFFHDFLLSLISFLFLVNGHDKNTKIRAVSKLLTQLFTVLCGIQFFVEQANQHWD